jgi:manganese oxidase
MPNPRRNFFARLATAGAALLGGGAASAAAPNVVPPRKPLPVETPDLAKLPFQMVDGVKEFRLTAEVVETELMPGRPMTAWGYNGSIPGPTLEFNEGERIRVIFENKLPEMTAIHWHGFEVPMEMDGSVGVGQDPVPPGGRFVHEFTLNQNGTFFYHSHFPMQEMMGMIGLVIVHPKVAHDPPVDKDYGIVLQEWMLLPNNKVPNSLAMEFNWLTFNGKSGPATTPLLIKQGERVRIRIVNLGMDHHPIHMHGHQFEVTGTEAGRKPAHTWFKENTTIVGVAQARDFEFTATNVGDWMLHCHLPHHMMNQMVTMVGPWPEKMEMGPSPAFVEMYACPMHPEVRQKTPGSCTKCKMALVDEKQIKPGAPHVHAHETHGGEPYPKDDPEKKKVPGYPQDMWMTMDEMFNANPANHGLRKGWSGAMMGMMTLVRVLPPAKYEEIMALVRKGGATHEHKH